MMQEDKEFRNMIEEKCETVRQYLAPGHSMYEIDSMFDRIRSTDEMIRAGDGNVEEFTTTGPDISVPIHTCPLCGNKDQQFFVVDQKQGDTICLGMDRMGCGMVVEDHKVHEGNMYRNFEGEVDRSHHGAPPNRLYSAAYNMRTQISKGAQDSARIANLSGYVEMNLSQVGKDEKRTRVGYKDQMKREAFDTIDHITQNCDLHTIVTERAKELFAGWRNVKEHVQYKNMVIAACIIGAYRNIAKEELRATAQLVPRCQSCGSERLGAFQKDGKGGMVCKNYLSNGTICGGRVLVPDDPLHRFVCAKCGDRFNTSRGRDLHQMECKKIVAGATVTIQGEPASSHFYVCEVKDGETGPVARLVNIATNQPKDAVSVDLLAVVKVEKIEEAPAPSKDTSITKPMNEWGVKETRAWLSGVAGRRGLDARYVEAVCAELEKLTSAAAINGQSAESNGVGSRKRKAPSRTAGQIVQMWSTQKFTDLCSGDAAAADILHEETAKRRMERDLAQKNKEEEKHARDRKSQLVRRPWVNAVAQKVGIESPHL